MCHPMLIDILMYVETSKCMLSCFVLKELRINIITFQTNPQLPFLSKCHKVLMYKFLSKCHKVLMYKFFSKCHKDLMYKFLSKFHKVLMYKFLNKCYRVLMNKFLKKCYRVLMYKLSTNVIRCWNISSLVESLCSNVPQQIS